MTMNFRNSFEPDITEVLKIIALMAHEDFEVMILTHLLIIVGELCKGQSRTTPTLISSKP